MPALSLKTLSCVAVSPALPPQSYSPEVETQALVALYAELLKAEILP